MKTLTSHEAELDNQTLAIVAEGEPGAGGARHKYSIGDVRNGIQAGHVAFQNGPIGEAGTNGVTIESLLAICKDRLEDFQAGDYACGANARALDCINDALEQLHDRTLERRARGVEGTSTV